MTCFVYNFGNNEIITYLFSVRFKASLPNTLRTLCCQMSNYTVKYRFWLEINRSKDF